MIAGQSTTSTIGTVITSGSAQDVAFSLEAHLLGLLAQERPFLTHEIHLLARAYGWSLGEILQLSRDDRRTLVRLCEAEHEARASW